MTKYAPGTRPEDLVDDDVFVTGRYPEDVDPAAVPVDRLDEHGTWVPRSPGGPRPVPRRRASRAVGRAMMLGLGRALQQIYDRPDEDEDAVVFEVDDTEPPRLDVPVRIEFDPDNPKATVAHVRRDLLD